MCVEFFPLSISRIRVFSTKNKTYNETNIQNGNDYWASKNINEIHNGMNLSFVRQHKTDISYTNSLIKEQCAIANEISCVEIKFNLNIIPTSYA